MGEPDRSSAEGAITYCLVPRELAPRLHEPLRRHFRDDPGVQVVVERRDRDRRETARRGETETAARAGASERRRVPGSSGRRVAERRSPLAPVDAPALPRRLRQYADRLVFFERLEPGSQQLEDVDTDRLVIRFQSGETDLFSDLYIRYFDRVYSYLSVAFRNAHDAEDATQQVFMKMLDGLPRYRRTGRPFRAWLFTIVRRYALTELEKQTRVCVTERPLDVRRASELADDEQRLDALDWISDRELLLFFERLPLPTRQVLMLRFGFDLSHREVAEIMGRSPDQVRNMQSRGLAFMRDRLSALGRESARDRQGVRRCRRQAPVLRMRRFALHRW